MLRTGALSLDREMGRTWFDFTGGRTVRPPVAFRFIDYKKGVMGLILGDCLEVMKGIESESIDAILRE